MPILWLVLTGIRWSKTQARLHNPPQSRVLATNTSELGRRYSSMRLLDLFCGGGGCSVGYAQSGFEVVGVDHVPQPDYPFEFILADATTFPFDGFDVVHASPPCQKFTPASSRSERIHGDLLTPMLQRFRDSGVLWVLENVPQAPMPAGSVKLCGSAFGLAVRRHRLFASAVPLRGSGCRHKEQGKAVGVYGNGGAWTRTRPGGAGTKVVGVEAARALGVDWCRKQATLAQMIPPAYAEFIGRQLLHSF